MTGQTETESNSVFLCRGYDETFQQHVQDSIAQPLSTTTKDKLVRGFRDHSENGAHLVELLQSGQITAWGLKDSYRAQFELIAPGDYFVLRTSGNDPHSRYYEWIQRIDATVGPEIRRPLRKAVGGTIWGDLDYEWIWFSQTPVEHIECSEYTFDNLLQAEQFDFATQRFFKNRRMNFRKLHTEIVTEFGGAEEFVEKVISDFSVSPESPW